MPTGRVPAHLRRPRGRDRALSCDRSVFRPKGAPLDQDPDRAPGSSLQQTHELLQLAKDGDGRARDLLLARYLPRLQRWASGRLPTWARSLVDTSDVVQDVFLRTLQGIERVEVRGPGVFQAYVRRAVLNRIRDEVRWASRRPGPDGVPEELAAHEPTPLERAITTETLERYESALEALDEGERELVHLRIELDFGWDEIATMTGRPSADAARMATKRALARVAGHMAAYRPGADR